MDIKNENDIRHRFKVRAIALAVATTVATSLVAVTDLNTVLYKTDVINLPEHAPFDGTGYPIKKIPDWTHLSAGKSELPYSQLTEADLKDVPYYDAKQLIVSTDSLTWGNTVDDIIRNAKITYSTPYLGNYLLDGKENGGSHPAVDIKVPVGTPVYSIGNGVVLKESAQNSGFGHHIVIQHNNFPSFENPDQKVVLYSSYSHLSENLVKVGDVVTKGQQIALSGESGTATTPHVHFQIDNDQAPWHPFWPFTWQEVSAAGLDFFSAINAGLGLESAKTTTLNPVVYVQKYMNGSGPTDAVSYVVEKKPESTESPESAAAVESTADSTVPEVAADGESSTVIENTESVAEEIAEPEKTTESTTNETNDAADLVVPLADAPKGLFTDVADGSKYYEAIKYLTEKGIIKGYEDGSFRPENSVNRVESLKFILESISAAVETGKLPFTDIGKDAWYTGYLYTAYKREIVNGHPDGTFRPNDAVNKAEFFKILFNGLSVDIDPLVTVQPYEDVLVGDWFASYISYAKEIGLLDSELKKIHPSRPMTRGEVAEAMYRLMKLVK